MDYFTFFLLIFLTSRNVICGSNDTDLTTIVKNCDFSKLYEESVNSSVVYIYVFKNTSQIAVNTPARINVFSATAEKSFPLLIVVRQQKGVLSWQLPYVVETLTSIQEYQNVSRTLCPMSNYYRHSKPSFNSLGSVELVRSVSTSHEKITVSISTSSSQNISFSLSASIQKKFLISLSEERETKVSASQPQYFIFDFPKNLSTVVLEVNSNDSICMTISIQNISCPVFDLEGNVQFEGLWQTVTRKGGITLTKGRFPVGFYIVFVVKGDDSTCLDQTDVTTSPAARIKTVKFSLREKLSYDEYLVATFGAFGVFISFYLVAFIVVVLHHMAQKNSERPIVSVQITEDEPVDCPIQEDTDRNLHLLWNKVNVGQPVFVSDMARKGCQSLREESQMYLWNLLTVATFYALPVVQLVVTYQRVLNNTGNQDLCFYNFLCSHPFGVLSDFNHVYSNIGYGMLGLLFILLVYRRERQHLSSAKIDPLLDQYYGLPQQFGLFYAMGAALIAEGILSACYHVCPNYTNFQFDTSFMYVISMMCMLRIYQNRHPDIHASAYTTFGALAVVIFIGMTGVLTGTPVFWAIFTVIHIVACLLLSAQVYYMGCWSLDLDTVWRVIHAYSPSNNDSIYSCIMPRYLRRIILLIIGNLVNILLAVFGVTYHPKNFASYLLAIFMANLNIYCWFYIIMKLVHRERILLQPLFYIFISFVLWGFSLYYFIHKAISWQQTPALSRTYNHACNLLNFYDNHDIWHFLSASSMFSSFMVLLTLDDNLIYVPRNEISVF